MFETIVVAVDCSPIADEVIDYTRKLAKLTQAQVVLVHAYPKVPEFLGEPNLSETIARHIEASHDLVDPMAASLQQEGIPVEVEILQGPPADAILNVADTRKADLIIMGARGLGSLGSLLLGSVSQKVLAHASCPVLIVRSPKESE